MDDHDAQDGKKAQCIQLRIVSLVFGCRAQNGQVPFAKVEIIQAGLYRLQVD